MESAVCLVDLIEDMLNKQRREFAIWCARRCQGDYTKVKDFIDAVEGHYLLYTHTERMLQIANQKFVSGLWKNWCAWESAIFSSYRDASEAALQASTFSMKALCTSISEKKRSQERMHERWVQVEKIKSILKEVKHVKTKKEVCMGR